MCVYVKSEWKIWMKQMKGEKAPRCHLKKNSQLCTQLFEISHFYLYHYCIYYHLLILVWQYFERYGTKLEIEWSILHHPNNNISGASRICQICSLEQMAILTEDSKQLLNKNKKFDRTFQCIDNNFYTSKLFVFVQL